MGSSSQHWNERYESELPDLRVMFYILEVGEYGVFKCTRKKGTRDGDFIAVENAEGKEERIQDYGNIFTNPYEALVDTIERNYDALSSLASRIDGLEYTVRNKVIWESS